MLFTALTNRLFKFQIIEPIFIREYSAQAYPWAAEQVVDILGVRVEREETNERARCNWFVHYDR